MLDDYHFVDKYRETYVGMVGPLDNEAKWDAKEDIEHKVSPPPFERQKGRLRHLRRRDADEARGGNAQKKICSSCTEFGHNQRTCPKKHDLPVGQGEDGTQPNVPRNPARDFEEYLDQLNQDRDVEPNVSIGWGQGRGRTCGRGGMATVNGGRGGREAGNGGRGGRTSGNDGTGGSTAGIGGRGGSTAGNGGRGGSADGNGGIGGRAGGITGG